MSYKSRQSRVCPKSSPSFTLGVFPATLAAIRRLAEISSHLPGADADSLRRVQLAFELADVPGWPLDVVAAVAWGLLDWAAIRQALGRLRGWTPEQIHGLTPHELSEVLDKSGADQVGGGTLIEHRLASQDPARDRLFRSLSASESRLFQFLLSRREVAIGEAVAAIYGSKAFNREDALKQIIKRLNRKLARQAVPLRISRNGNIVRLVAGDRIDPRLTPN